MNKNKNEDDGFDTFLTDPEDAEDGVEYIQPDLELKLTKTQRNVCREVVQEVKSFGIRSQRQILYLIYLLSLEVEDPKVMKSLVASCKAGRKDLTDEKKLILPT